MPSKDPEVLKRASKKYREKNKDNSKMKEDAAARAKQWAIDNRERLIAYRLANAERRKINKKIWIEKNREKVRAANLKWQKENPEYVKARNNRYKGTEKGIITRSANRDAYRKRCKESSMNMYDRKNILIVYRKCKEMNIEIGEVHHVDHIIPLSHHRVCGLHVSWNLQIIPKKDNLTKNNNFEG